MWGKLIVLFIINSYCEKIDACVIQYGQCGGQGYTGATDCCAPFTCQYSNPWYSQCLSGSTTVNPGGSTATGCNTLYSQCNGQNWPHTTCCEASVCTFVNEYYSQCLPGTTTRSATTGTTTISRSTTISVTTRVSSTTSARSTNATVTSTRSSTTSRVTTSTSILTTIRTSTSTISPTTTRGSSSTTSRSSTSTSRPPTTASVSTRASTTTTSPATTTRATTSTSRPPTTTIRASTSTIGSSSTRVPITTPTSATTPRTSTISSRPTTTSTGIITSTSTRISTTRVSSQTTTQVPTSTARPTSMTTTAGTCSVLYGQCGGIGWAGSRQCCSGSICRYINDYYSQCLPSDSGSSSSSSSSSSIPRLTTTTTASSNDGRQPGVTTRYWDCCKASCAWPGKAYVTNPVQTCAQDGTTPVDPNIQSVCVGGSAYMCNNQQPWNVSATLAYGFAAAHIRGQGESQWCCACYSLTFTSGPVVGKEMIVQVTNTGGDLGENHFDLQMPGGGVGIFDGCSVQFPGPYQWGQRYGGVSQRSDCDRLPLVLREGCYWRFDWFMNADNPSMRFKPVACPSALTAKTRCVRL